MYEKYYFLKYCNSKICLYLMLGQFFNTCISKELADQLDIVYNHSAYEGDVNIDVVYHNYQADGLLAWQLLDIEKPYISYDEMWYKRLEAANEVKRKNVDYYSKYLKNSVLLLDMILNYYSHSVSIQDASDLRVKYNFNLDEVDGNILVCDHFFETAGENVWNLFDIDNPVVGRSVFENIRNNYQERILNIEVEKIKKLGMKHE